MQDLVYELPRTPLPRTSVNKGAAATLTQYIGIATIGTRAMGPVAQIVAMPLQFLEHPRAVDGRSRGVVQDVRPHGPKL
jgi:hypothetical protein